MALIVLVACTAISVMGYLAYRMEHMKNRPTADRNAPSQMLHPTLNDIHA
jgi:hypothetical protein